MKTDIHKYRDRLYAIKRRKEVITNYLQNKQSTGYLITNVEFLCLQFRKIIEEIAFLSLIANKEEYSKQYDKFEKHWNARLIFRDLERINPSFYPEPIKQIEKQNEDGETYFQFEKIMTGFMTKNDAIKVYEKCGGMMHSRNPYRSEIDIDKINANFVIWISEITILLNHHTITLYNQKHMLVGMMVSNDRGYPNAFDFKQVSS